MRKFLAALSALLILSMPLLAMATEWKDGEIPSNGLAKGAQPIGAFDGSAQRALRSDNSGILRTTEEYPVTSQRVSFTAATAVAVTIGLKAVSNGYLMAPYGRRTLRIQSSRTAGATVAPSYVYLYHSDDNVNYRPLMYSATTAGAVFGLADTSKVDTVMIALPSAPAAYDAYYDIPSELNLGFYVQAWAKRDSATAAVTAQTITLTWLLREQ